MEDEDTATIKVRYVEHEETSDEEMMNPANPGFWGKLGNAIVRKYFSDLQGVDEINYQEIGEMCEKTSFPDLSPELAVEFVKMVVEINENHREVSSKHATWSGITKIAAYTSTVITVLSIFASI